MSNLLIVFVSRVDNQLVVFVSGVNNLFVVFVSEVDNQLCLCPGGQSDFVFVSWVDGWANQLVVFVSRLNGWATS